MVLGFLKEVIDFGRNCDFGEVLCFDCFGYFKVTDRHFFDFGVFGDYIALRRCLGFRVLVV